MFGDNRKSNSPSKEDYYLWKFLKFSLPGGIVLKIFESITGLNFSNLEFILISFLTGVALYCWFKSGENKNYRILAGIVGFFIGAMIFNSVSTQSISYNESNESGQKFTVVVAKNNVNIRAKPNLYDTPIGLAREGEKYVALSLKNGFYVIEFGSGIAYISAEYVKRE